jgi:hypothetical protein
VPIAPLVAALGQLRRNLPAPAPHGQTFRGVPFLNNRLADAHLLVEVGFGVDQSASPTTWQMTDVSADVLQDPGISITHGRQDEQSNAVPAAVTLTLLNMSGDYTPRRRASPYWPHVHVGLPIRVSVTTAAFFESERFSGTVDSMVPDWDPSGNVAVVRVHASGFLRRPGLGNQVLRSPLTRKIAASVAGQTSPAYYWPMEDASGSTSFAEYNGQLRAIAPVGTVNFANNNTLTGSGALPVWSGVAGFIKTRIFTTGVSPDQWQIEFVMSVPSGATSDWVSLQWTTLSFGSPLNWSLRYNHTTHVMVLQAFNTSGTELLSDTGINLTGHLDVPILFVIATQESSGGGGGYAWQWRANYSTTSYDSSSGGPQPAGVIYSIACNFNCGADVTGGQLAIFTHKATYDPVGDVAAMNGYVGEGCIDRFDRLCSEEGVRHQIPAGAGPGKTMGPQSADAFLNLIRECEAVDGGVIVDGVDFGVAFRPIGARYNAPTVLPLDFAQGHLAIGSTPVEDDQRIHNDWTVTRKNGSSARATQQAGSYATSEITSYADSDTVNMRSDADAVNYATWNTRRDTVDQNRYSTLTINPFAHPELANVWLPCVVGSRVTQSGNFGTAGDAADVVIEGWTEVLSQFLWTVTLNCAPYTPYTVFRVGDPARGRLGSTDSTLAADAAAGATSLTVNTNSGQLWTTSAAFPNDFPMDVDIDSVQVTVSAITGASSPQTFTVDPTSEALYAGNRVKVWRNGVIKL